MASSAGDVNELQAAEAALRRSQAEVAKLKRELQQTLDAMPALVVVFNRDGDATFANRPAHAYLGPGLPIEAVREAIHPDQRPTVEALWRTHLASGKPFQTEQRVRRADGQYRWHLMTRVPVSDETGTIVRWYESGYDIEDRKRVESELRSSEEQLAEARREL